MRTFLQSRALAVACWVVATPLAVVAVLRLVAWDAALPLIVANMFTPWLYVPIWGVLAVALIARRPYLAQISAAVAMLHLLWLAPGAVLPSAQPPEVAEAPRLRVMTANLLGVNHDTEGIVGEVLEARPDVLIVQELTPHWHASLEDPRLWVLFPERVHVVREDSFGVGVYSRLPIEEHSLFELEGLPLVQAGVRVGDRIVRVYAVHTLPPRTPAYAAVWERMMGGLGELLESERGPVILAGDLNATPHARLYRRLVSGRMRGAHEDRGRGLATTWPNGVFSVPSVRLDHVLLSPEVACLRVWEGEGRGSDHRPVLLDVAILG